MRDEERQVLDLSAAGSAGVEPSDASTTAASLPLPVPAVPGSTVAPGEPVAPCVPVAPAAAVASVVAVPPVMAPSPGASSAEATRGAAMSSVAPPSPGQEPSVSTAPTSSTSPVTGKEKKGAAVLEVPEGASTPVEKVGGRPFSVYRIVERRFRIASLVYNMVV